MIDHDGNELVRIRFGLDRVNVVVSWVSYIPGGLGNPVATAGKIPGTNDLFTKTGYTQTYMDKRGYEEFIMDNIPFI